VTDPIDQVGRATAGVARKVRSTDATKPAQGGLRFALLAGVI